MASRWCICRAMQLCVAEVRFLTVGTTASAESVYLPTACSQPSSCILFVSSSREPRSTRVPKLQKKRQPTPSPNLTTMATGTG